MPLCDPSAGLCPIRLFIVGWHHPSVQVRRKALLLRPRINWGIAHEDEKSWWVSHISRIRTAFARLSHPG
ncbi:uncharacterized protein LAJ45_08292 [Morchella importuna]|uniref:uncharacterized protein n=1 Tax=Morchella importuna TaxID=1174673 RepID=UPI001E8CE098|nr:uncharacterized protein LAJ45_08292 [Morchella importuna]KAH8147826.1 hypothetical protein LAJ45_08292 [Morchella importuna]